MKKGECNNNAVTLYIYIGKEKIWPLPKIIFEGSVSRLKIFICEETGNNIYLRYPFWLNIFLFLTERIFILKDNINVQFLSIKIWQLYYNIFFLYSGHVTKNNRELD